MTELLESAGLRRQDTYITNVVKVRPPHNDISVFLSRNDDTGAITETEDFREYRAYLHQELAETSCNVIIPVGNVSLYALLGTWGITKRRGSIYGMTLGERPRKVIPTFHPASALPNREPLNKYIIKMDLRKAQREQSSGLLQAPKRLLSLNPSFDEVMDRLVACRARAAVSWDIETRTQKVRSDKYTREMFMFSIAESSGDAMAVPLYLPDGGNRWTLTDETFILRALCSLLADPNVQKWGQNLHYDASYMYHRFGVMTRPIQDTMVAQAVLCPDLPKDLAFLNSLYGKEPYYKDKGIYDPEYSALDSAIIHDVLPPLLKDLDKLGMLEVYRRHVKLISPILHMQDEGFLLGKEKLKPLRAAMKKEMRETQANLDKAWLDTMTRVPVWVENLDALTKEIEEKKAKGRGVKGKQEDLRKLLTMNVKSTPQKLLFFYGLVGKEQRKGWGLGYAPVTNHGKPSTDADAMKKLIGKGCWQAALVQRLTSMRDDYTKYYAVRLDPDGRVRTSFNPVGTETGRFATGPSIFGTGFGFQTIPTRMREHMTPDPGTFFIEIDLAQAENRIVAYLAEDFRMMTAFENGEDVHCLTAGLVFGKPPNEISREKGSCQKGDGSHSERDWGKKANHAFNYGLGPVAASLIFECSLTDAKWLRDAYLRAYPNIQKVFWFEVEQALNKTHMLTNLLGRRRLFLGGWERRDRLYMSGYAYVPQSTVSDLVNTRGLLPLWDRMDRGETALNLRNQVHDSLWITAPLDRAEEAMAEVKVLVAQLEQPLTCKTRKFIIPADVAVGRTCGEKVPKEGLDMTKPPQELASFIRDLYQCQEH